MCIMRQWLIECLFCVSRPGWLHDHVNASESPLPAFPQNCWPTPSADTVAGGFWGGAGSRFVSVYMLYDYMLNSSTLSTAFDHLLFSYTPVHPWSVQKSPLFALVSFRCHLWPTAKRSLHQYLDLWLHKLRLIMELFRHLPNYKGVYAVVIH